MCDLRQLLSLLEAVAGFLSVLVLLNRRDNGDTVSARYLATAIRTTTSEILEQLLHCGGAAYHRRVKIILWKCFRPAETNVSGVVGR